MSFHSSSILAILAFFTGAAEAAVCNDYDSDEYNALPSLEQADERWNSNPSSQEDLLAVGGVISEFGLINEGAVALLHNHFSVDRGELMVRSRTPSGYLVCPANSVGVEIPYLFSIQSIGGSYALVPLEFVQITSNTKHLASAVSKLVSNASFIQALGAELNRRGLLHQLGLTLNPRLFIENSDHTQLIETSGSGRSLVLTSASPNTTPDDAVQVTWTFEEGAEGTVAGICFGCCKAHCVKHECIMSDWLEDGNCSAGSA